MLWEARDDALTGIWALPDLDWVENADRSAAPKNERRTQGNLDEFLQSAAALESLLGP